MATKNTATNIFSTTKAEAPVNETLEQKVARLEAALAAAESKNGFKIGVLTVSITDGKVWKNPKTGEEKATTKGRISLYGMQKQFPITLGIDQWQRIAKMLTGEVKVVVKGAKDSAGNPIETTFVDFCEQADKAGLLSRKSDQ